MTEDGVGGGDGWFRNGKARVHIAKVDQARYAARLRPRGRNEGVMVVGVAINNAAAKIWKKWYGLGFEKIEEVFDKRATLGVTDVEKIIARPERTGEIPFEIADCGWVAVIEQCGIDLCEECPEGLEHFRSLRFCFGECASSKKSEEPHKACDAAFRGYAGEKISFGSWDDTRQGKMRSTLCEMRECAALHVDKRLFASGVHEFENELAGIGGAKMKVVVVLAREGARG